MSIRQVSVFLTPKPDETGEIVIGVHPDPVVANIMVDEMTGDPIEVDLVHWQYCVQPPAEANVPSYAQAPPATEVYLEIRFAPKNTPFPQPTVTVPARSAAALLDVGEVEVDNTGYGGIGSAPLAAKEPRSDAALATENEPQQFEQENGFEFLVREYKYAVVLTTGDHVYTLDPRVKIRRSNRRLEQ